MSERGLNEYRDMCLEIVESLKEFSIEHVSREDNSRANELARQASGYVIKHGRFGIAQRPATKSALVIHGEGGEMDGDGQASSGD
jgi:hypothetical protein